MGKIKAAAFLFCLSLGLSACANSFNFGDIQYRPADISDDVMGNRVQTHERLRDGEAVTPYKKEKELRDSTLKEAGAEDNPDVELDGTENDAEKPKDEEPPQ